MTRHPHTYKKTLILNKFDPPPIIEFKVHQSGQKFLLHFYGDLKHGVEENKLKTAQLYAHELNYARVPYEKDAVQK